MKIHKLPIIGGLTGLVIIVCSIIRWFIIWYDPSQMIFGVSIGVTILIFSYIYNWMRIQDDNYNNINKRLDAFTEWWTRQEMQ